MNISLPAINKSVTIGAYVKGVKFAKVNLDSTFKHGLETWWPCTGRDIVAQFFHMVQDHCNRGLNLRESRYGKWEHSYHHAKKYGRKCAWCGQVFFPENAAQKCCSVACRRDYHL